MTNPSQSQATSRTVSASNLRSEIESHHGYLPAFYGPALEIPEVLENLWRQYMAAWVQNPLPVLFKQKLAAYLARFCPSPYCLVAHSCSLHALGISGSDILALLEQCAPREAVHLEGPLRVLASCPGPLTGWPESEVEQAILQCAAAVYLDLPNIANYRTELHRILGPALYPNLLALLAYVRTCHYWVEAHPGIVPVADRAVQEHLGPMTREAPMLGQFLQEYVVRVQGERQRSSARLAAVRVSEAAIDRQKRFHILADGVRDVLYRLRFKPSLALEYVSPAIAEVTGYTPEEFYADPQLAVRIVHPDDRRHAPELRGQMQGQTVVLRWMRRDGVPVWTEHCVTAFLDAAGEVEAIEGVARDITERRRSEERMRLLHGLAEAMNEAENVEAALEAAISRVCVATAWEMGEAWLPPAYGSPPECAAVWSRRAEEARGLAEAGRGAPGGGFVERCWKKGTAIWIPDVATDPDFDRKEMAAKLDLHSASVIPVLTGNEVAALLVFYAAEKRGEDRGFLDLVSTVAAGLGSVVRRKHAEAALRSAEERFRSIAESTHDAVVVADGSGRVQWWNRGAREMFGYENKEILGEPVTRLMPERFVAAHLEGIERVRSGGEGKFVGKTVEVDALRRDGTEFPVEVSLSSWKSGDRLYFGAILRDTTARRKLQEELAGTQREIAIGEVARGLAHEWNNMFTVILGNVILLRQRLPEDDALREHVAHIQRAAERAAALTRQLQVFARKAATRPESLLVNSVVSELEPMLQRLAGKDVAVSSLLTQDLAPIHADPALIGQLLVNLVVRSRDAMPSGGRICIETSWVETPESATRLAGDPGRPWVALTVSDSGSVDGGSESGVAAEESSTPSDWALGAAAIPAVARQCGGLLQVLPAQGRGTMIRISWPRHDAAAEDWAPSGEFPRGTETVLVVEDEPMVRYTAAAALRRCGYRVLEARQGSSADAMLQPVDEAVALVVTDLALRGVSGRDVARTAARRWPGVRILFISGHTETVVLHHLPADLPAAFLAKPFTPEALARKVRQVLDAGQSA
ncbi:MAG: PAS domain S-box protein [Planctomycetes bacterium]|nr:PAS domain S-box protein [Planctomycetota bacterium]